MLTKSIFACFVLILDLFFFSSCSKQEIKSKQTSEVLTAEGQASDSTHTPLSTIPVNLQTQSVTNVTIKNIMVASFNGLTAKGVNLTELSTEMGLSHTVTVNDIDFDHIVLTWDANNLGGVAYTANFKTNSSSNPTSYGFSMFASNTTTTVLNNPMMGKTLLNQYLKYYDLSNAWIITNYHYNQSTYSITETYGNYIPSNTPKGTTTNDCGQKVIDCFLDLYSHHGWLSVWATIQSVYIPATAVAVTATCIIYNCPH
jgi:hypothetical protein